MVSLVLASLLHSQPITADAPFSKPVAVAEANRLAATPKIDGKIEAEEWDPLTSDEKVKTYLEWEPGVVYVAGKLPLGQDMIVSLDGDANGWLIGSDNIEVRVSMKDGQPTFKARGLDGSGTEGPHWYEMPGWEKAGSISATTETGAWTFELALVDPGLSMLPGTPGTIGVRVDPIDAAAPAPDAFFPRAMTRVNFVMDRSAGLPEGLIWKPQILHRATVPGDTIRLRQTFKGNNDLHVRRMDMRTEGDSRDATMGTAVPFPEFDRKDRAYVDYVSRLEKNVRLGWYVQRSTISTGDGVTSVIESSWRAAPLIDFDLPKEVIESSPDKRVMRFALHMKSNSSKRIDGVLMIQPPTDWRVMRGSDRSFIIPQPRGESRKTFELEIPARATGIYPMIFKADVGGKIIEKKLWLNVIDRPEGQ